MMFASRISHLLHIVFVKLLKKLKCNSSSGPDGFPPLLYKKLADCIAGPLSLLFTAFMSVGCIPQAWAHALDLSDFAPVYKGGPSSNPSNYRPISLTCTACKIMERVVVSQMLSYLHTHKLITNQQHGFLSKRSTTTNLLETLQD